MEIRQLRYFSVLGDELHFYRAAEQLCIAQPALSRQIQQLESELNVELFRRTRRRVEITESGKLFLERTQRILADLDRAASDARKQTSERGRIGMATREFQSYPACLY